MSRSSRSRAGSAISITARQLASDARESARLARLTGTGQVNVYYSRAQHGKIAEDVKDAIKSLDAPPPRGREVDTKRAVALAMEMKTLLDATPPQLAEATALSKLEQQHSSIAAELEGIASR